MKILFLASAYHRAEAFSSVCNSLEALCHTVTYYPIYMKVFEAGQAAAAGKQMDEPSANRLGLPVVWDETIKLAASHDLVIVWKAEALTPDVISAISSVSRTVYYSWDDPYQLEVDKNSHSRAMACHVIASCCEKSAKEYVRGTTKKSLWLPPGYDPKVHYEECKPEVDVCFIGTNTYCRAIYGRPPEGDPPFDRRDLVNAALKVTDKVELWGRGSEPLGWIHPDHGDPTFKPYYKGYIKFEEARKAFSRARICVNSHVRRNGYKYFNERTFQIMGCSRAQLIDNNPGTEEVLGSRFSSSHSVAFTYDTIGEFQDELREILKERAWDVPYVTGKMAFEFSKEYTWDKFCQKLVGAAL